MIDLASNERAKQNIGELLRAMYGDLNIKEEEFIKLIISTLQHQQNTIDYLLERHLNK